MAAADGDGALDVAVDAILLAGRLARRLGVDGAIKVCQVGAAIQGIGEFHGRWWGRCRTGRRANNGRIAGVSTFGALGATTNSYFCECAVGIGPGVSNARRRVIAQLGDGTTIADGQLIATAAFGGGADGPDKRSDNCRRNRSGGREDK